MNPALTKVKRQGGHIRRAFDFYETPKWQTAALRRRQKISGTVFEPCVGDRSIANEFSDCEVWTNDLNRRRAADSHLDAACPNAWNAFHGFDWVVTNPPFNKAFEILELAHQRAHKGVAMLLRLSFLEPTDKRGNWLSRTPPPIANSAATLVLYRDGQNGFGDDGLVYLGARGAARDSHCSERRN